MDGVPVGRPVTSRPRYLRWWLRVLQVYAATLVVVFNLFAVGLVVGR